MTTATATCDRCLDGRHVRCRRPCACNLCAAQRRNPPTFIKAKPKRRGPRPRAITDKHIAAARELLDQEHPPTLSEIARRLDVDRSGLHRQLFGRSSGRRKVAVPKLANPRPLTPEIVAEAAQRISDGNYSSFTQLAFDLHVERTGLYKRLKSLDLLPPKGQA